jgi:2-oxoacid:acceptor oxidoreductase delta subunit (pyruvate/2-ketoisovalerate family)
MNAKKEKMISYAASITEPGSSVKNKTGLWRTFRPKLTGKCMGCGLCATYCPEGAIKMVQDGKQKKAVIDYDYCKGCMICIKTCLNKVIGQEREK